MLGGTGIEQAFFTQYVRSPPNVLSKKPLFTFHI